MQRMHDERLARTMFESEVYGKRKTQDKMGEESRAVFGRLESGRGIFERAKMYIRIR